MRRDRLARIERIERALAEPPASDLPLSRHELHELLALERERAERFPGSPSDWPMELIDEFMSYQCGDPTGPAARLDHLRQRSLTPAQRAEDRAMGIAIAAMDATELDDFMAAMTRGPVGDHQCRP